MNTWQWIALVVVSLQVYYPLFYPGANRWLWKKTFRWCNYAVAVLQAVVWLVLKATTTDQAYDWPYIFLVSPFVFYSLHLIFDRIIWRMYTDALLLPAEGRALQFCRQCVGPGFFSNHDCIRHMGAFPALVGREKVILPLSAY